MTYRYEKRLQGIVIDSDPQSLYHIERTLKMCEMSCYATSSQEDFFSYFSKSNPDFCLIDLNGQGQIDGYNIIKDLRKRLGSSCYIFGISSASDLESVTKALNLGAVDYFAKPVDKDQLKSKLSLYFESKIKNPPNRFYNNVSDKYVDIEFPLKINGIDEMGIKFSVNHLIPKGTLVKFSGDFVKEVSGEDKLLGTVSSVTSHPANMSYSYYAEFENLPLSGMNKIRNWIQLKLSQAA